MPTGRQGEGMELVRAVDNILSPKPEGADGSRKELATRQDALGLVRKIQISREE